VCVVNAGPAAYRLPLEFGEIALASAPMSGRDLPPDAAAWCFAPVLAASPPTSPIKD
jgi:hypothetical protein